jgi:hypothetical protein
MTAAIGASPSIDVALARRSAAARSVDTRHATEQPLRDCYQSIARWIIGRRRRL